MFDSAHKTFSATFSKTFLKSIVTSFSWSRHLYVRIYAAVLLALAVVVLVFYAIWHFYPEPGQGQGQNFDSAADFAAETLAPASADADEQEAALNHRRWRRYIGLALYSDDGQRIAATGIPLPPPDLAQAGNGWLGGRPPVMALRLPDGRWLLGQRMAPPNRPPRVNVQIWLALLAVALGIGAWPVARRITGRLERLQTSVEALGAGQLSTRVAIEGQDEVARLAESFNRSASRIEQLVQAQKSLLANASHELRSPLTRIRMAVELMGAQAVPAGAPDLRGELVRNIAELDQLVDEILLASRLESLGAALSRTETIDLTALLAEECARVDAQLDGDHVNVSGDARLLRRLLRNLLENAKRYGEGSAIHAHITTKPGANIATSVTNYGITSIATHHPIKGDAEKHIIIDICDGGRGVPPEEREKIFAPFYRLSGARERDGGVGLGLALVRQIARAHGGEVECLARNGGGSCFRVRLIAQSVLQSAQAE